MDEKMIYRVEEMIGYINGTDRFNRSGFLLDVYCIYFAAFFLLRKFGGETNHTLDEVLASVPFSKTTKAIVRSTLEKKWEQVCKVAENCSPKDYSNFFLKAVANSDGFIPES